ncbi:hypothetical protein [Cohnella sp. WQ 127256]|uniref:hypothetical protein n=1 Tax=Cohnella sp. WQ 127256 TaxID=2938790 RepID=UPI0021179FBD|nr:hypothetical protein [Cohnella sp. WQ 127256]
MNKWIILIAITFMLTGCNEKSAPNASKPTATAIPKETTSVTPAPTAPSAEPIPVTSELLDTNKLPNTFGFANNEGNRIITVASQQEQTDQEGNVSGELKEQLTKAIGEQGQILTIRYVKHQARSEKDNGRQAAHNFDNLEGDLYEVIEGTAVANDSYYLINETSFNLNSLIKINPSEPQEPQTAIADKISKSKNRAITHSWLLATTDKNQQIFLVQFERQEDQMLASLVLYDGVQMVFMDYPATYDANSTWRVDDQGEVIPEMFSFLFAAASSDGIVIAVKWMGAEGENITVLKQSGQRFVETSIESGRYLSPI